MSRLSSGNTEFVSHLVELFEDEFDDCGKWFGGGGGAGKLVWLGCLVGGGGGGRLKYSKYFRRKCRSYLLPGLFIVPNFGLFDLLGGGGGGAPDRLGRVEEL